MVIQSKPQESDIPLYAYNWLYDVFVYHSDQHEMS